MNEKSLIYSLFSKFLDEGQDETPREEDGSQSPEREQDKKSRPQGQPYDSGDKTEHTDRNHDTRVETVEDWNETEQRRRQQMERELLGQEHPENAPQESEAYDEERSDFGYGGVHEDSGIKEGGGVHEGSHIQKDGINDGMNKEEVTQDAKVELLVSDDRMSVSMMVYGPSGGGSDITEEMVWDALEQKGICFGIDRKKIEAVVGERQYRQMVIIAGGEPARNGEDGHIKDYYPRKAQIKYASKGNGGIDFKSTNLIHNVKKGDVVCDLTLPTEPEDGMDVYGQPVRGKKGTMPPVPQGKNIVYSEDRDRLLTACEGNLTFRSGRFHVENVFTVSGNVDNSVGNINFTGSVVIHGDVLEGYSVKAKGDITVMGIVEGARLSAGGDILLHKGMRGMRTGVLEAEGDITAKFLEDCNIYSKDNIQAEYIINSEVSCGHDLTLIGKKGAFIGGSCSVYNCMNVKAVGAPSHIATSVTLGLTPQLMDEMEAVGKEMILLSRKLTELNKDISYLNGKLKEGTITPSQRERLSKLKLEAPINSLKEKKLKQQGAELSRKLREVGKSRLTAREVYPGTVINIGDCKMSISKKEDNCTFYYLDGEIRKGIR
ncbi:MAG: FapA family protein [Clostridia bacterium]|nr:FapA family protein [Clostridia bacterium]